MGFRVTRELVEGSYLIGGVGGKWDGVRDLKRG